MRRILRLLPKILIAVALSACGGGQSGSGPPPPASMLSLLAGNVGGSGSQDGTGAAARFSLPQGVASDSGGNVYVADGGNDTIRKITPAGVVTTLAGTAGVYGSADGMGSAARFQSPAGIAIDSAGNLYVADSGNATIRKVTTSGVVTTLAGTPGAKGSADGLGAAARFEAPETLATDSAGNIYVTDVWYSPADGDVWGSSIRKITPDGAVTTLAGSGGNGSADGTGVSASFYAPHGIATDSAGNIYVADSGNDTVRKITPAGVVTTLAGTAGVIGSTDGTGPTASFNSPSGVAVDSAGNIYIADSSNATVRMVTPAGVVTTVAGASGKPGSVDGTGSSARFNGPTGEATDGAGNLWVADTGNSTVRKVTPAAVVTTLAGAAEVKGSADGTGSAASFNQPLSVATDGAGNVYVADGNNAIVRKITPAGVVSTLAGSAGTIGSTDGAGAGASFQYPTGVAADNAGNVYVADNLNATIRKVTPAGVVTTLAGSAGATGSVDGVGATARFNDPHGVAVDASGNVFVADSENGAIRKITPAGVVTTLARGLVYPISAATDSTGNVYVADLLDYTVWKITPAGELTTLAGLAGVKGSTDGLGAAARFFYPAGVATDSGGNVYVADSGNDTLRKITPDGLVTTVVGQPGQYGFLPGPLPGLLAGPQSVALFGTTLYTTTYNAIVEVSNVP